MCTCCWKQPGAASLNIFSITALSRRRRSCAIHAARARGSPPSPTEPDLSICPISTVHSVAASVTHRPAFVAPRSEIRTETRASIAGCADCAASEADYAHGEIAVRLNRAVLHRYKRLMVDGAPRSFHFDTDDLPEGDRFPA